MEVKAYIKQDLFHRVISRWDSLNHGRLISILLAIIIVLSFSQLEKVTAQETLIYLTPEIFTAPPGDQVTVNLMIRDSPDLYAWYVKISFNPEILSIEELTEGPFLSSYGTRKTDFIEKVKNEDGWAYFGCCLKGEPFSAQPKGSGKLAEITFKVKKEGETSINISYCTLYNYWGEIEKATYSVQGNYFKYPHYYLAIQPEQIFNADLTLESKFNINISCFVEKLHEWNLTISWDKNVLNLTEINKGPLLEDVDLAEFNYTISNDKGYAILYGRLSGTSVISGVGVLTTLTFQVIKISECNIELNNTALWDNEGKSIIHAVFGGWFSNAFHDIEVLSVNVPMTVEEVNVGDVITINVTLKNNGNLPENNIIVKLYLQYYPLGSKTLNLDAGEVKTVTFTWNTKDAPLAEDERFEGYLWVYVQPVMMEKNVDNNSMTYGKISIQNTKAGFPYEILVVIIVLLAIILAATIYLYKRKLR